MLSGFGGRDESSGPRRRPTTIKNALNSILGGSNTEHSSNLSEEQRSGDAVASRRRNSAIHTRRTDPNSGRDGMVVHLNVPREGSAHRSRRHSTTSIAMSTRTGVSASGDSSGLGSGEEAGTGASHLDSVYSNYSGHATSSEISVLTRFDEERALQKGISMSKLDRKDSGFSTISKDFVGEYLLERGFLAPKPVVTHDQLRISVAANGNCVFLPTISSNEDEYLSRLNGLENDSNTQTEYNSQARDVSTSSRSTIEGVQSASTDTVNNETRSSNQPLASSARIPSGNNFENSYSAVSQSRVDYSGTRNSGTVEIDDSMSAHNIAVIASFNKAMNLSELKAELCSRVRIYWHDGVPPSKTFKEEIYNAGTLSWTLNSSNFNLYVPIAVSSKTKIIENNGSLRQTKFFKVDTGKDRKYMDKLKYQRTLLANLNTSNVETFKPGDYIFILPIVFSNNIPESIYLPSARVGYRLCIGFKSLTDDRNAPTNEMENLTEKTNSETELTHHHKSLSNNLLKKVKKQLHIPNHTTKESEGSKNGLYVEYPINIVRTPPPFSISTANKSVYINRVWSDSLSYEISFGQKYVPVNGKLPIKIKLAPLDKNMSVKRLRISVVEKITFVSKNLEYEYDQIDIVTKDPYNPYYMEFENRRRKDRNLSLLEIRTKEKGSRSIREEIVDNCINENLLSYNMIKDSGLDKSNEGCVGFNEPVTIVSTLEFPKYADLDQKSSKVIPPYGIDSFSATQNVELETKDPQPHSKGVIGFFTGRRSSVSSKHSAENQQPPVVDPRFHETKFFSNSDVPVKFHTKLNKPKRGLYLDSLHYSNIHCRHKLEIMFRICKPDAEDPNKIRNYEVLVDIPIFVVSELCNNGNLELPTYDAATSEPQLPQEIAMSLPPTFEQAVSVPASPLNSPLLSPLASLDATIDDLSLQSLPLQRNLSDNPHPRTFSDSLPMRRPLSISAAATSNNSTSNSSNPKFSNLDDLLFSSTDSRLQRTPNTHNPFKSGYTLKGSAEVPSIEIGKAESGDYGDLGLTKTNSSADHFLPEPPSYEEIVPLMSDSEN